MLWIILSGSPFPTEMGCDEINIHGGVGMNITIFCQDHPFQLRWDGCG